MRNLHTLQIGEGVTDAGLRYVRSLTTIEKLLISSPQVTDEGLRHIAHTTGLKELNLEGTNTTGAGLLHLTPLTRLEKLTFDGRHSDVARLYVEQGRSVFDALVSTGQLAQRPNEGEPFELHLEGEKNTDDLIEFLVQMPMLRGIALKSTAVTDVGLKLLGRMPQLNSLGLHGDEVWQQVPAMPHIEILDLSDTTISANQLSQHLRSFPKLKSLRLNYTPIADEDLAAIGEAQSLQELLLGATKIGGHGLRHLSALTELRHLHLGGSTISDDGLRHLSQLRGLRELSLEYTSISDAGTLHLQELKSLRKLVLVHTDVTQSAVNELEEALPDCEFITR